MVIVNKKRDDLKIIPLSALVGTTVEQLIPLLTLFNYMNRQEK